MIFVNSAEDSPTKYQALRTKLEDLKVLLTGMYELTTWKSEVENIERSHLQILELFQSQFINRDSGELLTQYYVEINKQLRLLGADINLMNTSRQAETLHKRIGQADNRLKLLLTYCDQAAEING